MDMVLTEKGDQRGEETGGGDGPKSIPQSPLHSSAAPAGDQPLTGEATRKGKKNAFFRSSTLQAMRYPSQKIRQLVCEKDEISYTVISSSSSHHLRQRLRGIFSRKIDWDSLRHMTEEWFRNPMNIALFIWIVCVAVSGAILFLVMTGMLNRSLPKKSQRDAWFEVNNQILNALFTLMCLYQHPKRFHHLAMLMRWSPEDILRLRKVYCKNGTYKPHDWAHMIVVVTLLHINCFAQYALCGLNVAYKRSERPPIGVAICICVAIASPAIAGVYTIVSPLGKEYDLCSDGESPGNSSRDQLRLKSYERRLSFALSGNVETNPRWRGGILDLWEDISLAYLSIFCTFCVFGWNMERLGFGNMYVHIATFLLFCTAPYWIFNLAALNIDNEAVRRGLGVTGALLCVLGLLYGGYWRIRMRKRFDLPTYTFCCGKSSFSDCTLWLFCGWCSLAQELRTANSYNIVDNKFHQKNNGVNVELGRPVLPASGGVIAGKGSGSSSPVVVVSSPITSKGDNVGSGPDSALKERAALENRIASVEEESLEGGTNYDKPMIPPSPLLISKEGD